MFDRKANCHGELSQLNRSCARESRVLSSAAVIAPVNHDYEHERDLELRNKVCDLEKRL